MAQRIMKVVFFAVLFTIACGAGVAYQQINKPSTFKESLANPKVKFEELPDDIRAHHYRVDRSINRLNGIFEPASNDEMSVMNDKDFSQYQRDLGEYVTKTGNRVYTK